jgi:3-oxoacyl-[acyl-carrier-protein] synthase II
MTEMTRRRVVITGLGVVSNIGIGISAFTEALKAGKCGTSPIRSFDASGFPHRMGGEIHNFDPTHWLKRLTPTSYARTSQFAAAAARMAAENAGIDMEQLAETSCGVSVGTTNGNNDLIERFTAEWLKQGPTALVPSLVRQIPASRLATAVNEELDLMGEAITISSACAAGNYAIGYAYDLIQAGETDYMLCGGADGAVPRWVHAGFYRLGAISPSVCKPFDKQRQGILIGEGAGMLFLETLESAQRRKARIYAEVIGYGLNCDATHITTPNHVSIAECMRIAHTNAGIEPKQIDYICAHGTGTKVNDSMECRAIHEVFGCHKPAVSSIKSMIGHTMGAASALGAVACALAIYHGFIPPTINFEDADPECDVDCVTNHAREATLNIVQNNGFAFGGNNAIMILGRESWISQHLR